MRYGCLLGCWRISLSCEGLVPDMTHKEVVDTLLLLDMEDWKQGFCCLQARIRIRLALLYQFLIYLNSMELIPS